MKITQKDLEFAVSHLNTITGMPQTSYSTEWGNIKPNAGNYHLDGAYGGWKLSRMCKEGTGTSDVLGSGFTSKKDLYNQISSYTRGVQFSK